MKVILLILLAFSLVSVGVGYNLPASSIQGNLNMTGHNVIGLATPTNDTDAATKAYADAVAVGGGLPTTGGVMTGQIDFGAIPGYNIGAPVNDSDVSTKKYVDDEITDLDDISPDRINFSVSLPNITLGANSNITFIDGWIKNVTISNSSTDAYSNVKAFGAKGDNSTDDTAAIQAAIDSTDGGPVTVFFPDGRYNYTTLILHSGVELLGVGWSGWYAIDEGSLLVHKSNTTQPSIVWDNTGGSEGDSWLAIRNLGIIGDQESTGHGIYMKSGYNYYIESCMISGFVGANVYMDSCGAGYIQDNRIYYAKNNSTWSIGGAGIYANNCGDWHIDGNDIGNAAADMDQCHGLYLLGSSGHVTMNKIFYSKWGIFSSGGIIATANWINDLYEYGIFLTGVDNIIQGNMIQNISSGPFSGTWVGIATSPGSANNTIIANRIIVPAGLAAIYINGGQQTIEGNTCVLPIYWPRTDYMADIPTAGYWDRGSIVWYTDATAGVAPGAVCVSAGTPGTWKNMSALSE